MTGFVGDAVLPAAVLTAEAIAVGYTAVRVARRLAPEAGAALDRAVVGMVTAVAHLVVVMQVLGALGLLRRGPVLLGDVAVAVAVLRFVRPAPAGSGLSSRIRPATVGVFLVGAWFGMLALVLSLRGPSVESDTAQYHVPNAAFWLRRATLWPLPYATPGYFTNSYPSNGELTGLWLMLPSHDDRLAYLAPILFAVLAVLATALATRELGGSPAMGALAATAVITTPLSFSTQVHSLMVDLPSSAGMVAGLALALGARRRGGQWGWVAASGVAFGLAIGSKYPVLIPGVAGVAALVALMPPGRRLRAALVAGAGTVALAGFWFVRTWWDTGNPIFPKGLAVAGHTVLTAGRTPLDVYATSMLEHVARGHTAAIARWAHWGWQELGPALLVLALGAAAAGWRLFRHRDRVSALFVVLVAVTFVAYLATPYTGGGPGAVVFLIASQLRYALPAALLLAAAAGTVPAGACAAAGAAALIFNLDKAMRGPGFRGDINPSAASVVVATVGAVALVGAITAVMRSPRRGRVRSALTRSTAGAALATLGLLVAGTAAGAVVIDRAGRAPALDLVSAALRRQSRPDGIVLLVAVTDVRPALGRALRNNAVTVGAGGAAGEEPIGDAKELDRRTAALRPAVVVVGPGPIGRPDRWVPPGWRHIGDTPSGEVYIPPSAPPP